jgi:Flp pilus assembly protein TadB
MTVIAPMSWARAFTDRMMSRLIMPFRSRRARSSPDGADGIPVPTGRACVLVGVLAGLAVGFASSAALGVAAGAATATVVHAAAGIVRRRRATRRRLWMRKALRLLSAELLAGSPPEVALDAASDAAGVFAPALRAAAGALRNGDDVASALRGQSRAVELVPLAAAFAVCSRSGAGIAAVLSRVEADLRAGDERARAVGVALAGPRSSSVLLALLPVVGVALGAAMGAHPFSVLLGSSAGQLLLAGGIVLDALGLLWTMRVTRTADASANSRRYRGTRPGLRVAALVPRIRKGPPRQRPRHQVRHSRVTRQATTRSPTATERSSRRRLQVIAAAATTVCTLTTLGPIAGLVATAVVTPLVAVAVGRLHHRQALPADVGRAVPLTLDLIAAMLHAGHPVSSALASVATAVPPPLGQILARVADQLDRGMVPKQAWRELATPPMLAEVAHTACRSAESGIRLAAGFEALAAELRAEARADAEARAHRAGVLAIVPLGACFLPAFLCIGVVPVVIGVARGSLGGLQ